MKEKIKCMYCKDLNYTTSSNCKKCGENLYRAPKKMIPFWIITIILALIYFGFIIKGTILAIVGEISLIVAVFACLCCWISLSKKEEEKKIKIYPLQVKIHPVTRTQYIV